MHALRWDYGPEGGKSNSYQKEAVMQKLKRFEVFLGICILLFPMVKVSAGKTKKAYITSTIKNCEIGDKFYVKLKGTKTVSYEILDETVATVNSKGKVKTKRAGKTKLVITGENGKKYTCKINVYDTKRAAEQITVLTESSKVTANIKVDEVPKESYKVTPGMLVNFTHIIKKAGTPEGLVYLKNSKVTDKLTWRDTDTCRLQKEVIKPLSEMIDAAYAEGKFKYSIISGGGYRAFETQYRYWQRRMGMNPAYGDDPYHNGVICVPAVSSEHRTGYAIDFDATDAGFAWLEKNSYKYGFIKRYYGTKTIFTGVMDEPYHFTYVGKSVAATCYLEGICLEEYYEKYVNVEYN